MTTIWVVEQGQYSDYRVVGLFSSRENADRVASYLNGRNNYSSRAHISEWPLDPLVTDLNAGRTQFEVSMRRDGTVSECEPWRDTFGEATIHNELEIWGTVIHDRDERYLHAVVWASDADHAVKIANEKRGQMIASGAWRTMPEDVSP